MGNIIVVEDKKGNRWLRLPPATSKASVRGPEETTGVRFINVNNISGITELEYDRIRIRRVCGAEDTFTSEGYSFDDLYLELFPE